MLMTLSTDPAERAKDRQQEAEKKEYLSNRKQFLAWNKNQGNWLPPSGRGNPEKGATRVQPNHQNKGKQRVQWGPSVLRFGDFLPKHHSVPACVPAPVPMKSAWEKPLVTQINPSPAVPPGAKEQIHDLLQNLTVLLQGVL